MLYLSRLWKFSRPHTIIGTSLSVVALYTIALATSDNLLPTTSLGQFVGAWIACLCGNVYIVGLNQLYDIEIDRVNKPDLPLASGDLSIIQGKLIVGITGVSAIAIAASLGQWLLATVAISLAIGTAYSLPPVRFKRFPFLAAICILSVRGCIVNLGLFSHFNRVMNGSDTLPSSIWVLTLFILVFTIAIAIQTFTLALGKSAVFKLTRSAITLAYLATIGAGLFILTTINLWFFVGAHVMLLGLLWWRSQDINLEEKESIADFYQFIWKLFFLEYLLFPIACFIK
jgi:homogentisate phytyltransferase / homogentisate geranylgeranyltransferase